MLKTVEAVIEADGTVRLLEPIQSDHPRRALLTILDEPVEESPHALAVLSEAAFSEWGNDEEDRAWSHLQSGK